VKADQNDIENDISVPKLTNDEGVIHSRPKEKIEVSA